MWVQFFICLFLGMFGVHKFLDGKIGMGFLYLFTMGLFGIGWLVDCVLLFLDALRFGGSDTYTAAPVSATAPSDEELKAGLHTTYNPEKESKEKSISSVPADNNESFRQLSELSRQNLQAGKIGFYRCNLFDMANILEKEGRLKDALREYLYVFYLDCTGINSLDAMQMGFTPHPMIAPGVVRRIRVVKKKLPFSDEELKEMYFSIPSESKMLNTIFSFQEIYNLLTLCLDGKIDEVNAIIEKHEKKHKDK